MTATRSACRLGDDAEVVRDQQQGHRQLAPQAVEQVENMRLNRDVERRGRLISDQQTRPAGHRHCDHHALPLTAGQLTWGKSAGTRKAAAARNPAPVSSSSTARFHAAALDRLSCCRNVSTICAPIEQQAGSSRDSQTSSAPGRSSKICRTADRPESSCAPAWSRSKVHDRRSAGCLSRRPGVDSMDEAHQRKLAVMPICRNPIRRPARVSAPAPRYRRLQATHGISCAPGSN